MADSYDPVTMKETKDHFDELVGQYSARNTMFEEIENMFLLEWTDKPANPNLKITISPSARNAALGAIRLLTATDPVFKVPFETTDKEQQEKSEKLEKAAEAMWDRSGKIKGCPIHYTAATSAILFGEMHLAATLTADLVQQAKGASPAAQKRAERIAAQTPVLFECYSPAGGYPEFDDMGLSAYARKVTMKSGTILDRYGSAQEIIDPSKRYEDLDLIDYWDLTHHIVWLDGRDGVLVAEEHNLPVLPITAQITEGTELHKKQEHRRQPFLYTLWKSDIWKRQNLSLSMLYTLVFALGNPQYVYQYREDEPTLKADYETPGGIWSIRVGESLAPLAKQILPPELMSALSTADQLESESTMYKQALGQPPEGGNNSFSMVSLLSQSGRLPLISPQKRGGWGIGGVVENAFLIMRERGGGKVTGKDQVLTIKQADIPENLTIEAQLDISLPQDKLQNANIAGLLIEKKVTSRRWARENVLQLGQSDAMQKEIWTEEGEDLMNELFRARLAPAIETYIAQAMNQAQQGGMQAAGGMNQPGGMQPPLGGGAQAQPPDLMGQPGPGGAAMQGGLPQAMGGMLGAQGPDMGGGELPSEMMGGGM